MESARTMTFTFTVTQIPTAGIFGSLWFPAERLGTAFWPCLQSGAL